MKSDKCLADVIQNHSYVNRVKFSVYDITSMCDERKSWIQTITLCLIDDHSTSWATGAVYILILCSEKCWSIWPNSCSVRRKGQWAWQNTLFINNAVVIQLILQHDRVIWCVKKALRHVSCEWAKDNGNGFSDDIFVASVQHDLCKSD